MLAHKLQVDVPQDHKLSLDLPESFPAGPAEVIVLATPREQRKIVRAAGVLSPEGPAAKVTPGERSFLDRRGQIKIEAGSVIDDVRAARALRGSEGA